MSSSQLLLIGHLLVFGAWFGTDIATFILSRRVLDRSAELAARTALASAMTSIEVIARLCLPTMLGFGLALSIERGFIDVDRVWVVPLWVLIAVWVGLVWVVHRGSHGAELASRLAMVDLALRSIICAALWIAGVWSLLSDTGPILTDSLAAKVVLFAVIMTCGITIRFQLRPFAAAFGDLIQNGSTPEREAALSAALRRAQPLVGVIWVSLIAAAALGVTGALPWS